MKQRLKTRLLDDKPLRLCATLCQQQIIYLYIISPCKQSYKKEIMLNLKVSYMYCKSFIDITVFF